MGHELSAWLPSSRLELGTLLCLQDLLVVLNCEYFVTQPSIHRATSSSPSTSFVVVLIPKYSNVSASGWIVLIVHRAPDSLEWPPHRAGLKLEAALDAFGVDVRGVVALDSGLSTGGFTDCLLQRGAARVYGVDVGFGQASG